MKKRSLSYINLLSRDNQKLTEFYRDVVGLTPMAGTSPKWCGFESDTIPFAIEPMTNRDKYEFEYNKNNPVLIQFRAESLDDITAWTEDLEKKGVPIGQRLLKKSYGTVTTFTDPDGNVVEILWEG